MCEGVLRRHASVVTHPLSQVGVRIVRGPGTRILRKRLDGRGPVALYRSL
jgi:hypothetical protein